MPKRKRNETNTVGEATQIKAGAENFQPFTVASSGKNIQCERRGKDTKPSLIFTHGAGGGLSNAATKDFADGFAEVASVVSFQGNMNLKARVNSFKAVIEHEEVLPALGGRSMGARAAVLAAQEPDSGIKTLILVSYPMVGAQKGDSREQILLELPEDVDVLFISGSNDSMCGMSHLRRVIGKMKARSWVIQILGADHGMSLKTKDGTQPIRKLQGTLAAKWMKERDPVKRFCELSWSDGEVIVSEWYDDE